MRGNTLESSYDQQVSPYGSSYASAQNKSFFDKNTYNSYHEWTSTVTYLNRFNGVTALFYSGFDRTPNADYVSYRNRFVVVSSQQNGTCWGSMTTNSNGTGNFVASQSVETNYTYGPYKVYISTTDQNDTASNSNAGTWWGIGYGSKWLDMLNDAGNNFDTTKMRKNIIRVLFRL